MDALRIGFTVAFSTFLLLAAVGPAGGALVTGTNAALDAAGGDLFIPLTDGASGTLGDPLGGGKHVGLDPDTMRLNMPHPDSSGFVRVVLEFDLSGILSEPLDVLDPAGPADLVFTLEDVDFKPQTVVGRKRTVELAETMELWFLDDAGDAPGATPDLVIDAGNYLSYRLSPSGDETADLSAVYAVGLADLGVLDLSGINADREFGLLVELTSSSTSTGTPAETFVNSADGLRADFVFETALVPEPATLALMALGGLAMALGRRRR